MCVRIWGRKKRKGKLHQPGFWNESWQARQPVSAFDLASPTAKIWHGEERDTRQVAQLHGVSRWSSWTENRVVASWLA